MSQKTDPKTEAGQGRDDEELEEPTLLDNTAVRGKTLTFAGIGGQFGIVCGIPQAAVSAQPAAGNVAPAVVAPAIPAPVIPQVVAPQPIVAPAVPEPVVAASPVVLEQAVAIEQSVAIEEEEVVVEEDVVMEEAELEDTLLPKDHVEEPVAEDRMEK
jgi:hypothetical protein